MEPKTSGPKLTAAERRLQALTLRKSGYTFAQIGVALDYSEQRAYRVVMDELRRLNAACAETAADLVRLQEERIDALLAAVWPLATGRLVIAGDKVSVPPCLDAVAKAIKLLERLAALRGIDAPKKVAPTSPDGYEPYKLYAGFPPEDV